MLRLVTAFFVLAISTVAQASVQRGWPIAQPLGVNVETFGCGGEGEINAQAPLNAMHSGCFWQMAKSAGGGLATNEEWNTVTDKDDNVITFAKGWDRFAGGQVVDIESKSE